MMAVFAPKLPEAKKRADPKTGPSRWIVWRIQEARLLLPGHTEFSELLGDIHAVGGCFNLLLHVQDLAVLADVVGPAIGESALLIQHAKGLCGLLPGIAQNRIVEVE
jgi:hypothetical protein